MAVAYMTAPRSEISSQRKPQILYGRPCIAFSCIATSMAVGTDDDRELLE
jgi:uncharacterized protein (DUF433 family)